MENCGPVNVFAGCTFEPDESLATHTALAEKQIRSGNPRIPVIHPVSRQPEYVQPISTLPGNEKPGKNTPGTDAAKQATGARQPGIAAKPCRN